MSQECLLGSPHQWHGSLLQLTSMGSGSGALPFCPFALQGGASGPQHSLCKGLAKVFGIVQPC